MPTFDSTPFLVGQIPTSCPDSTQDLPFSEILVVAGAARSGTIWIGQILDSSPEVAYRFQPFFSCAFQGRVKYDSSPAEWASFLRELYFTHDPFVLQQSRRNTGEYPIFAKSSQPRYLALKTCRYQYLLRLMLKHFPNLGLIATVRHPAAVINSWLRTPSEFPDGSDVAKEWRFGAC
ncbi:MAG: sulfotransferase, partial [Planctomycetota bacterium]|nr:sulfotransferase [Planctomycetota bacterium]